TTTLDLTATVGGNQPADSVTVTDPDPGETTNNNPFDSFNLVGFKKLDIDPGIQAEVRVQSTGGYQTVGTYTNGDTPSLPGASGINASDVTGVQVVYTRTDGDAITAGTDLGIQATVALRDTQRSDSSAKIAIGTVHNQAAVTATYPDH